MLFSKNVFASVNIIYNQEKCTFRNFRKDIKRYKRNTTSGDLHRYKKITYSFGIEIRAIAAKYDKAGYPRQFIKDVIRDFITPLDKDESFVIR